LYLISFDIKLNIFLTYFSFGVRFKMWKELIENWILVILDDDLLKFRNNDSFLVTSEAFVGDSRLFE